MLTTAVVVNRSCGLKHLLLSAADNVLILTANCLQHCRNKIARALLLPKCFISLLYCVSDGKVQPEALERREKERCEISLSLV